MYALVKFIDDNIYYVCNTTFIKSSGKNVQAKWCDGQFYSAEVIVQHAKKYILNELKQNLECNLPIVVLSSDVNNSSYRYDLEDVYSSTNSLLKYQTDFDTDYGPSKSELNDRFLIENTETTINKEPNILKVGQHVEVDCSLTNCLLEPVTVLDTTDVYSPCNSELELSLLIQNTETAISKEPNIVEARILKDVEIVLIDQEANGSHFDADSWIESQCISTLNEISNLNEVQCRTEDQDLENSNNLHDVEFHVSDEGRSEENNSFLIQENQQDFQDDSIIIQRGQKRRILQQYNREVVVTPSINEHSIFQGCRSGVVSSSSDKKRQYFCIYCKRFYAKFPQHLQVSHKNQPAVKMFMNLPPKNPERKKIIETIRRRGDFLHNTSAEYNSGELLVARRSHLDFSPRTGVDYLPCPHCAAFFRKDTLYVHVKRCMPKTCENNRTIRVLSRTLLTEIHPRASDILKSKIFPVLREHDCVQIIRYDILTILYGNHLCSKYSSQHHHDMIRNRLRSIGRLLLAAKRYNSTETDFAKLLTPAKFDVCVASIKDVGGLNSNHTTFKAPTTVLTLSTVCKQAAEVWKTECIKNTDVCGKQLVEDFLTLFKVAFPAELANTAIENRVEQQRQKVVELPVNDDIQKLVSFVRCNRREWFSKVRNRPSDLSYAVQQLASFTLVSLMVFNRRRPGELERITIKDCSVLKFADSALSLSGHLTNPEEVRLARKYKRFEIRGKLNRTVPVLVEFETEACINLIIEKREEVGISSENPYVFARPSTDHRHKYLRAYILLRTYANLCGATRPDLIRATLLRKQIATECALNDLADNQIRDVANFMGHAIDIHNNIYRRPIEKRDIIQMSQILEKIQGHDDSEMIEEKITSDLNLDNNTLNPSSSVPINQQETNETALQMSDEPNQSEDSDVSSDSDSEEYTPKPKTKRKHIEGLNRVCGAKRPWTNPEKIAVIKNFEEYIKEDRLPSMDQLLIKLAPLVELKNRSPTSVRSWIQNELQRRRSNGQKTVLKSRWTPSMKMELKTVFRDHFEDSTLPSSTECAIAIDNCREFQHLTVAALKTAVANEQKRINKNVEAAAQLSKIWR